MADFNLSDWINKERKNCNEHEELRETIICPICYSHLIVDAKTLHCYCNKCIEVFRIEDIKYKELL